MTTPADQLMTEMRELKKTIKKVIEAMKFSQDRADKSRKKLHRLEAEVTARLNQLDQLTEPVESA